MFGFNDALPAFNLRYYLANLVKFFILSFVALLIHNKVQKYYANKVGASTELSFWYSQKKILWFKKKITLPMGAIIPFIVTLISNGQIFFAAPTVTNVSVTPAYRLGRKHLRLTEFEYAKIAVISPLIHILIAILLNFINVPILKDFALVNTMMALSYMLPLPNLLGYTAFFSSKPLYVFSAVFILASAFLLNLLTSFYTILVAIILALTTLFMYFWQFYKK